MKKLFFTLALGFLVFYVFVVNVWAQETIDFEGIPAGTIVSTVHGDGGSTVGVFGYNPNFGSPNAAMIFDSSNPTGGDDDLGTPNNDFGGPGFGIGGQSGSLFVNNVALGNLLIISEDLNSGDPDDADVVGAAFHFDFSGVGSGSATVSSITIIDVEADEPSAKVELFDGVGGLLATFTLPQTGDNGVAKIGLGPTSGVVEMIVTVNGSGAIDNIVFTREEGGGDGCTPGYWKQRQHFDSWVNYTPTDLFGNVFGETIEIRYGKKRKIKENPTLLQALEAKGGGINALARHTVAALLNAASPDVSYDLSEAEVINAFKAVYPGTKQDYNSLKNFFSSFNEQGCPLN